MKTSKCKEASKYSRERNKTKEYVYCEQCGQRIDKIEYEVNGCVCNACFDINNGFD